MVVCARGDRVRPDSHPVATAGATTEAEEAPVECTDPVERTDESGATAVEYAILASLIAVVIAATVALLGDAVTATFQELITQMGW